MAEDETASDPEAAAKAAAKDEIKEALEWPFRGRPVPLALRGARAARGGCFGGVFAGAFTPFFFFGGRSAGRGRFAAARRCFVGAFALGGFFARGTRGGGFAGGRGGGLGGGRRCGCRLRRRRFRARGGRRRDVRRALRPRVGDAAAAAPGESHAAEQDHARRSSRPYGGRSRWAPQ